MKCACGAKTRIIRTIRLKDAVWRRHHCGACGVRFETCELTVDALAVVAPDLAAALWREQQQLRIEQFAALPETAASRRRQYLRRQAREDAAETGEDVRDVYRRWGCA